LVRFFLKILEAALAVVDIYRTRYAELQKLSVTARNVRHCFKASPEKFLQVAALERQTVLPRRTIQYALKTLTDKGFLQRLGSGTGSRYQLIFKRDSSHSE